MPVEHHPIPWGKFARKIAGPRIWLPLLSVALVVGLCAVATQVILDLRREAWAQAERGANNVVTTLQKDITRSISLYDLSLQNALNVLREPELLLVSPSIRRSALFDGAAAAEHLAIMMVVNGDGRPLYSSAPIPIEMNLSDRPFFIQHKQSPDDRLLISSPAQSRLWPGDYLIPLSRRIANPDGSFGGIVVGGIRLGYFRDLFDALQLGPHATMTLQTETGKVVARAPFDPAVIGRDLSSSPAFARFRAAPSGSFIGSAAVDGMQRLYVFRRVGDYPLIVDVAVCVADIDATWWGEAVTIGVMMLTLCLMTLALVALFRRELGKRLAAERLQAGLTAQYRLLADNTVDMITHFGPDFRRSFVSPASRQLLGYRPEELVGRDPLGIVHPSDRTALDATLNTPMRSGCESARATYRGIRKDGSQLWLESSGRRLADGSGFVVVTRDISDRKAFETRLQEANSELARLANVDALTGLMNRRGFDVALDSEYRRAVRELQPLGIILIDVDSFKAFNDLYGHPAGDDCLRRVALGVQRAVSRAADLVARYGGEELVVILPNTDLAGAQAMAEQIRLSIRALHVMHAGSVFKQVTISAGATAWSPGTAETMEDLVRSADLALYEAKSTGRDRVVARPAFEATAIAPRPGNLRQTG